MENSMIILSGTILSCIINCIIIFHFISERYQPAYYSKRIYRVIEFSVCIFMICINMLNKPVLNMISWLVAFGVVIEVMYIDPYNKQWRRLLDIYVLIVILTICETVGCVIFDYIIVKLGMQNMQPAMMKCSTIIFSKLVVITFYYAAICRIWKSERYGIITAKQYVALILILLYGFINLLVIIIVESKAFQISMAERLLLLVNMFCIVFGAFYFLYFVRFIEENNKLETEIKLLEQQSEIQYEYYLSQEDKYNDSIKILHDVNKHLNMIRNIYEIGNECLAKKYADEIETMLKPLGISEYTNNPILNILLNDKARYAKLHNVDFEIKVGRIDFSFMKPVEVTTIFANLLDNAIDAVMKSNTDNKYIIVNLDCYNDFIVINITNSFSGHCIWKDGKPVSNKGKNHGLGLINVEKVVRKYSGNILMNEVDNEFICNIIMNP